MSMERDVMKSETKINNSKTAADCKQENLDQTPPECIEPLIEKPRSLITLFQGKKHPSAHDLVARPSSTKGNNTDGTLHLREIWPLT